MHFPVTSSLVAGKPRDVPVQRIGKTFTGAAAVNGLSCLLALTALVACSGSSGDSSTQPPALAFAADCQGTTANPFTQPPAFVPSAPSLFLPDNGSIQVPPAIGPLGYNSFIPGLVGFPIVGGTYTDPIFGGTVRRLTDTVGFPNQEDIYGHHWANANGSFAFTRQLDNVGLHFKIINTTTGAEVYTNQPLGSSQFDIAWDATDPNRYYYYEGANLTCRNLVEQRNVVKTFPSPLERNGGSLNTQDRSGRYFTVRYGGSNKVWDSQTDTIYSGSVTPLNLNGWVAITPDGKYLVTAAGPNQEHYSYAIDHMNHSISPTPVNFWTACQTDHGALVSATNGKNYFITFDCNNTAGIYRVDITLDQTGKTELEQIVANQLLLPTVSTPVNTNQGHLSAVSKEGPNQDWVFFDSETLGGDDFSSAPIFVPLLPWQPYEQEIVAMNVTTLEVRRYAHHRSRNIFSDYHAQPRISCSWDGSIILWTSNYNTPLAHPIGPQNDYADMYGMAFSGN
jgi:hypothetical protein